MTRRLGWGGARPTVNRFEERPLREGVRFSRGGEGRVSALVVVKGGSTLVADPRPVKELFARFWI